MTSADAYTSAMNWRLDALKDHDAMARVLVHSHYHHHRQMETSKLVV